MAPGTTFVHDFAGVDRPMESVLAAVPTALSPESVRELVLRAWAQEAAAMASGSPDDAAGTGPAESGTNGHGPVGSLDRLGTQTGPPRVRRDAIVMPVSWSGAEDEGLPPLESDVEFTSFGDDRTHVHLYGRTTISAVAQPGTSTASLTGRVAVAVVRRFLGELVELIEASIPEADAGPDRGAGAPEADESAVEGQRSGPSLVS